MEAIKQFIITLVTTIVFMTAVDIIAPDKPIKKYIKLVLGLILISVMLQPIVYMLTSGETKMVETIKKYEDSSGYFENDSEKNVSTAQEEQFKNNLDNNCKNLLEEQFVDNSFAADIACSINLSNMSYSIEKVSVGVSNKKKGLVEKIVINLDKSKNVINDTEPIGNSDEIKSYLSEVLKVSIDKIELYRMEG